MRENRTSGTVRGVPGNRHSYRESAPSEAWCILQGASPCLVRSSHPPVSSVAPVAEQETVNKTGEAYTENHAGRRGGRAPRSAGTASKWQLRTPRVLTCAEGNTEASDMARMWRSAGVIRPWHA